VKGQEVPTLFGLMTAAVLDRWPREKNIYFSHMMEFVDLVADISHYTVGTDKFFIFKCCENVLFFTVTPVI